MMFLVKQYFYTNIDFIIPGSYKIGTVYLDTVSSFLIKLYHIRICLFPH